MKKKAVCIRCGTFKKEALVSCPNCEFVPKNDYEAARSLILSEKMVLADIEIGQTMEDLHVISESIRNGRPYPIDGEEQKRVVRAYYAYLKSLPAPKWYQHKKVKLAVVLFIVVALVVGAAWWATAKYFPI